MSRSASTEPPPNQSPIPSILVRSASPRGPEQSLTSSLAHNPHLPETPPSSTLQVPKRSSQKRTYSEANLSTAENVPRKIMAPRSSKKEGESSSKKLSASSSVSKAKSKSKPTTDDWTEVTEPEERRRIQNKLAQRKFRTYQVPSATPITDPFHPRASPRQSAYTHLVSIIGEKNRESKERAERDARNQQHAGSCYQVPAPSDVTSEHEVSGLPWGTFSMRHVVSRGHEAESRRSSGRDDYLREDGRYQPTPFAENMPYSAGAPSYQQHGGSFGGSSTGRTATTRQTRSYSMTTVPQVSQPTSSNTLHLHSKVGNDKST
ncbi:unnamed protein product [Parascedosporium putredinis]|uniref:BZIP domain-containing protein n=1 Tax=Parascedosporium putredinis TaxID=1442378 RepID=A0A9P1M6P1_9PEZI|nr:unnamed protein product [Parascedosporium putredinis]CAI7987552.1 unnamed protein product [Parascedosporium putredinis]